MGLQTLSLTVGLCLSKEGDMRDGRTNDRGATPKPLPKALKVAAAVAGTVAVAAPQMHEVAQLVAAIGPKRWLHL